MLTQKDIEKLKEAWTQLADQSYEVFGVNVEFFYKRIKIDESNVPMPYLNSFNQRQRQDSRFFLEEEFSEKIKVKLYWTPKEWKKVLGDLSIPDGSVVMLSKIEDSEKINSATMAAYNDGVNNYKFTKLSKGIPHGFDKDKYIYSIWSIE
jgi:hypothetical protein